MGNASGREEDPAAAAGEGDVEDSSVRSSERGFPPYGGGATTCGARARWASSGGGAADRRPGAPAAPSRRGCSCPRSDHEIPRPPPPFGGSFGWPSGCARARA